MIAPEDVVVLAELLDSQFAHTLRFEDARIFPLIPPLLMFISAEPRLAGLVADMRLRPLRAWKHYEDINASILLKLRDTWGRCEADVRALTDEERSRAHDGTTWDFDDFGRRLAQPLKINSRYTDRAPDHLGPLLATLALWVDCAGEKLTALQEVVASVLELVTRHDREWRLLRVILESDPGVAFDELLRRAHQLIGTRQENPLEGLVEADSLWRRVDDDGAFGESEGRWLDVGQAVAFLNRLHLALATAIAIGQSRHAIVRRYCARSESFDRARLLELIRSSKRRVEAALTLDFARYLFDAGFNPILSPMVGGLKPDVLHVSQQPALYVEAKQSTSLAKAKIRRWVGQVFSTWRTLANQCRVPEAFLLIYRRGGVHFELPEEIRQTEGRSLRIHVVDLAPPQVRGSRAPGKTVVLSRDDLLPPQAGERKRRKKQRKAPSK